MMSNCFLITLNCTQEEKNTQYSAGGPITTKVKRLRVMTEVKIALLMNQVFYRNDIFELSFIFNIFLLNRWMDQLKVEVENP